MRRAVCRRLVLSAAGETDNSTVPPDVTEKSLQRAANSSLDRKRQWCARSMHVMSAAADGDQGETEARSRALRRETRRMGVAWRMARPRVRWIASITCLITGPEGHSS